MMTKVAEKLIFMDKSSRTNIILSAFDDYINLMHKVAFDIYDSCIRHYYAQYIPKVYTRHGDLGGFNLYKANEISYSGFTLSTRINADSLEPYETGGNPSRDTVLTNVMNGIRGGYNMRIERGWPKQWSTSYPNMYSKFGNLWSSSKTTIEDILVDFETNAPDETGDVVIACIARKLGI